MNLIHYLSPNRIHYGFREPHWTTILMFPVRVCEWQRSNWMNQIRFMWYIRHETFLRKCKIWERWDCFRFAEQCSTADLIWIVVPSGASIQSLAGQHNSRRALLSSSHQTSVQLHLKRKVNIWNSPVKTEHLTNILHAIILF